MDIVLEIVDYFVFDKVYAQLLPKGGAVDRFVQSSPLILKASKAIDGLNFQSSFNSTTQAYKSTMPLPVEFLTTQISKLQNKDEIYGLKPVLFPATEYMNASFLPRSHLFREFVSIFLTTALFGWILYFSVAYLSYLTVFDRKIFNHPRYLKNQMYLEIHRASTAIPVMVLLTTPFFLAELRGYLRLYMNIDSSTGGWKAVLWQVPTFILFTDCFIYFIHRILHWPSVYKMLHKPHHKWIVCTPFALHAFHPVDGWAQSLPYHVYPFLFPLHKVSYLLLFTFVNFWTVMIHDGQYLSNDPVVNGTACHTVHHLYFNYNYGQFTTLWDRLGGSYRRPDDSWFVKNSEVAEKKIWKNQVLEMETIRGELEGKNDDRVYVE